MRPWLVTALFMASITSLFSLEATPPIDAPPEGATPYEKTIALPDPAVKIQAKESGFNKDLNGSIVHVGKWTMSLSTGELIESGYYDATGKKTGNWARYFPGGKKMMEMSYVQDGIEGAMRTFNPDGKMLSLAWFTANKLNGISIRIGPDDKIQAATLYKNGEVVQELRAP